MKIAIKIISIISIVLVLISIMQVPCNAAISIDNIQGSAKNFLSTGEKNQNNTISVSNMKKELLPIAEILTMIGTGVVIICAIVIGIKYMVASPDEQAKLKKQMVGLVLATIVIFGAYGIWKALYQFMNTALN